MDGKMVPLKAISSQFRKKDSRKNFVLKAARASRVSSRDPCTNTVYVYLCVLVKKTLQLVLYLSFSFMSLYEAALRINTDARAQRRPIARGGGNNAAPGPNFSSSIYTLDELFSQSSELL